ncbi:unnamed protein product [Prorocentrum cordatum]|uniref:Uncharacterized protein n=1 Tax=Prorocentrum cordatum TaxID=2364126 RepID=A0ABN9X9I7_9DINO|nr:unnamed protein product [Polarella glacialis]
MQTTVHGGCATFLRTVVPTGDLRTGPTSAGSSHRGPTRRGTTRPLRPAEVDGLVSLQDMAKASSSVVGGRRHPSPKRAEKLLQALQPDMHWKFGDLSDQVLISELGANTILSRPKKWTRTRTNASAATLGFADVCSAIRVSRETLTSATSPRSPTASLLLRW